VKGIQVCSNQGPGPLQRGDNHKNVKWCGGHLKIIFSRTTRPILTRLGTNHPWKERIQVSLKEGDSPSPRGDNSERVKIHRKFLKIFFCNLVVVLSLSKRKVVSLNPARAGRVKPKTFKIGSDCSFAKSTAFRR
jgi:hypothetical protein